MTDMSQTFDELNALWQAEVDELKRSVKESELMIFALLEERSGRRMKALLEGQRTKVKVWVVVSDGHNLDAPCVNVCATEARALQLVSEMWEIWQQDYIEGSSEGGLTDFEEPVPFHQGDLYTFEHPEVDHESTEWHYVYEVEIDNG